MFQVAPYLGENTALKFIHVESGASIRVKVNFDGRDEMGLSLPIVMDEPRFDATIASVDINWPQDPVVQSDGMIQKKQ
jgi:hypothetical protein